ncbi:hypothetical protein GCM10023334_000280 [Nonomuraea thailandensis]
MRTRSASAGPSAAADPGSGPEQDSAELGTLQPVGGSAVGVQLPAHAHTDPQLQGPEGDPARLREQQAGLGILVGLLPEAGAVMKVELTVGDGNLVLDGPQQPGHAAPQS